MTNDEPKPETQTEPCRAGNGSGGSPTTIGTDGPGDDGDSDLFSWPIPDLVFVQIDAYLQSDQSPDASMVDPLSKVIADLNAQKANIALVTTGKEKELRHYLGASLSGDSTYETLVALLDSAFHCSPKNSGPIEANQLVSKIVRPLLKSTGMLAGLPSLSREKTRKLSSPLSAIEFGMIVLAIPIPDQKLADENYAVEETIQKSFEAVSAISERKESLVTERLEYMEKVRKCMLTGGWLTGHYYFAPEQTQFDNLEANLRALTGVPCEAENRVLEPHINSFGLLRNKRSNEQVHNLNLLEYRYLYPLDSCSLANYLV